MSQPPIPDAPDEGGLEAVGVPLLLAQAWRDRRSGVLRLAHGQAERTLTVREGAPTDVTSSAADDGFAAALEQAGQLSGPDRARVEQFAADKECPEASAALALGLLDAKALYTAMRADARRRIAETFGWATGNYRWQPLPADAEAAGSRPFDPLALLQQELPRRWSPDRLFGELMGLQAIQGDIGTRHRRIAQKLASAGEPARRAIAALDGRRNLGRVLGDCAGDPLAAATLWVAVHAGVLRVGAAPALAGDGGLDFEVEVSVEGGPRAASARGDARGAGRARAADDKGAALREEIDTFLGQLEGLDHYGALGLDEGASAADIKKAYFKAAKRYHPDALARMGLDDVKSAAATVFARIAEAFETLSDVDKRRTYDASNHDEPEIDTARLAQAETSFRKGEILAKMGNFHGALEYLEPAVELWPDEPAYQAALGWALYKQPKTDLERAAQHLAIALEQAPDDAVTLFRLGLVKRAAGEKRDAEELIGRARSIEPDVSE